MEVGEYMKKAVLYTRVSTDKDEQKSSLENQREMYKDYCSRNNYELIDIYADVGTGTNVRRRPDFIRMITDAGLDHVKSDRGYDEFTMSNRKPKFNYIIVKDAPRFSRNQHIGLLTLEYLRNKGVYVIFENVGLNTESQDWHERATMMFMMAQTESKNMGQRISFTKKFNAERGVYNPAVLPYGYLRDEDNNFIIDEQQAWIVQVIFRLFERKGGLRISRFLNQRNIPTQRGKKWSSDKIIRIIKNTAYYGSPTVNRSVKINITDTHRTDRPKSEHIEIKDALPPIVSKEVWDNCNRMIAKRTNKAANRGKRPAINDIYHEKLYCQLCGSRFVRHVGHKDKINYMCQNRRKGQGCKVRGISINNIDRMFNSVGTSDLIDDMGNYIGYKKLINRIDLEKTSLTESRNNLTFKIKNLEEDNANILNGIKEQFKGGSQSVIQMLTKNIEENEKLIKELESQRNNLNIVSLNELEDKVKEKRQLIEEIQLNHEISKDEKLKLLDKVIVGDYECIINFNFPDFKEEILEFNSIFPMSEIESVSSYQFKEHFRRDHKDARKYWEIVDESNRELEEGSFYVTSENIGAAAIETEKILDETNL